MKFYDGLSRSNRELLGEIEGRLREHYTSFAEHTVAIGKELIKARNILGEHRFSPWLVYNFSGSRATAYRYISLAQQYGDDCLTVRQLEKLGPSIAEQIARQSTPEEAKEALLEAAEEAEQRGEKLTREEGQAIIALCKATADEECIEEVEDDEEDRQDEPAVESDLEVWKQEQVKRMEEEEFRDEELRKGISQVSAGLKHMATSRLVRQPILDVLHSGLGKVRAILARREKKSRPEYTKHKRGRAG